MERVWASRLRWRVRGAMLGPAFVAFVIADAVFMHYRPLAGDTGPDWFPALLLAGFLNLAVVAVAAPLAGHLLRRRRRDLPQVIAGDRAGTVLLGVLAAVIVAIGIANHGTAGAQRAAIAAGMARVREYVRHNAPAQYRRRIGEATILRFGEDLYRTCVPGDDPRRWLCLFVFTDQDPPGLRRDTNRAPNSSWFPPDRGG